MVKRKTLLDLKNLPDEYLADTHEAAVVLGLSPPTLNRWRTEKVGPIYIRVGERRVRYRIGDLRAFLARRTNMSARLMAPGA